VGVLRVGLIGCGKISEAHLRGFAKTSGCIVRGVYDIDSKMASECARKHGIGKVYTDVDELIANSEVVDVCTPPQTHASLALKALSAGRHLLIEKPMVTKVEDWFAIREAAENRRLVVTVVHNLKFLRCVQQAKCWVNEGKIGRLLRLNRQFLTDPASDRMLAGCGHWSHSLPGGRWFETLPHELYLTHWFAGPLPLGGVVAQRTPAAPAGVRADEVQVTFRGERSLATFEFSASCRTNRRMLTLLGTDGIITLDLLSDFAALSTVRDGQGMRGVGRLPLESAQNVLRWVPDRCAYAWRHVTNDSPHARIIRQFDLFMQGKAPTPTPLDEVDYVVKNCELIGREIDRQVTGKGRDGSTQPWSLSLC
jgi:predicted dehydrogenase